MAGPQKEIPVAADVLGTIGTVFWCIQLFPQIWKNWRNKSTDGVTGLMFLLWATTCPVFGAYAVIQNFNIPLKVQPNILSPLAFVCWGQTLHYHNRLKLWKTIIIVTSVASFSAAVEVVLVFVIRAPYERGIIWPVNMLGIVSDVLFVIGLVPPYFELYRRNGRCVGMSFRFLAIDMTGAFLSLMALVVQHTFDLLGGLLYIAILVMEVGIITSHLIWMFRFRHHRKEAKSAEKASATHLSHANATKELESQTTQVINADE